MEILEFKSREELIDEVSYHLSHVSISLHPTGIRVKEERGLDEYMKTFQSKQELLEYLSEII